MSGTISSMSNLKAFIRCDESQEFMYHPRNQIPNKEINTKRNQIFHTKAFHNQSPFIIMGNLQTLLPKDGSLIVMLETWTCSCFTFSSKLWMHFHQCFSSDQGYTFEAKLLFVSLCHAFICVTEQLWSMRTDCFWSE